MQSLEEIVILDASPRQIMLVQEDDGPHVFADGVEVQTTPHVLTALQSLPIGGTISVHNHDNGDGTGELIFEWDDGTDAA
jgi:hypothetical protein